MEEFDRAGAVIYLLVSLFVMVCAVVCVSTMWIPIAEIITVVVCTTLFIVGAIIWVAALCELRTIWHSVRSRARRLRTAESR